MLNKEKFKDEILEIACMGANVALNKYTNRLGACGDTRCSDCAFNASYNCSKPCNQICAEWCNSEYKEPEIDWSKVPVDTPIYINDVGIEPRYFSEYHEDTIYYFPYGFTSFTNTSHTVIPINVDKVTLARPEDIEKYSK